MSYARPISLAKGSTEQQQASTTHVSDRNHETSTALPPGFKPHPIKPHVDYQFWNPVGNGLMQMDLSTQERRVKGNGSFDNNSNTVVRAEDNGHNFYLYFKDGESKMYITPQGEGGTINAREVKISEPIGEKCIFEPLYYWGYTMFQNLKDKSLYLGCDDTGKATLVKNADLNYPNPQALFIAKRVV